MKQFDWHRKIADLEVQNKTLERIALRTHSLRTPILAYQLRGTILILRCGRLSPGGLDFGTRTIGVGLPCWATDVADAWIEFDKRYPEYLHEECHRHMSETATMFASMTAVALSLWGMEGTDS